MITGAKRLPASSGGPSVIHAITYVEVKPIVVVHGDSLSARSDHRKPADWPDGHMALASSVIREAFKAVVEREMWKRCGRSVYIAAHCATAERRRGRRDRDFCESKCRCDGLHFHGT